MKSANGMIYVQCKCFVFQLKLHAVECNFVFVRAHQMHVN